MTKIFIATPAFDGKVHVQYAVALSETVAYLNSIGIGCQLNINSSGSLLCAERNRLNKAFLASDCTYMLCIDSDLGWPAIAVKALIDHDMDFIGGCYPARGENVFLFRPLRNEDGSIVRHETKLLLKMRNIPAGFMLMKRCVIEKMTEYFSHRYFEPKDASLKQECGTSLFSTELIEGEFWGEDYVFCTRARAVGFDIWVDPLIQFDHAGQRGMLAEILSDKKEEICL